MPFTPENQSQYEIHPAADAFPLLDHQRLQELAADIKERGQVEPISLLEGKVIDGRNRLKACQLLGITPKTRNVDGNPWALAWSLNGQRRDLLAGQRHAIWKTCNAGSDQWEAQRAKVQEDANKARAEKAKEQIAKQPRDESGKVKPSGTTLSGPTRKPETAKPEEKQPNRGKAEAEAAAAGVDRGTVEKNNWLEKHRPDLYAKVAAGELSTSAAHTKAKNDEKAQRKEEKRKIAERAQSEVASASVRCEIIHADCAKFAEILEANSFDWVITDPPYPKEFLHCYDTLADLAEYALKPGGSLICMIGQSYLPQIIAALSQRLSYQWTLAYLTPGGQAVQQHQRKVNAAWKPVLWFVKGQYQGKWIGDVTKSSTNDNDKGLHHWGQSVSGMADLVSRFVSPGDSILDPFLGAGTTGHVAVAAECHFTGIEIDPAFVSTSAERMPYASIR
jgi:hypothetical protein